VDENLEDRLVDSLVDPIRQKSQSKTMKNIFYIVDIVYIYYYFVIDCGRFFVTIITFTL
jgi:hypothetical protein